MANATIQVMRIFCDSMKKSCEKINKEAVKRKRDINLADAFAFSLAYTARETTQESVAAEINLLRLGEKKRKIKREALLKKAGKINMEHLKEIDAILDEGNLRNRDSIAKNYPVPFL